MSYAQQRITITKEGLVRVGNEIYEVDPALIPADVHALQWHNGAGVIENTRGDNVATDTLDAFADALAAWQAAYDAANIPPTLEQRRNTRARTIKGEARSTIEGRFPDYEQRNMTARMLELTRKESTGALTADEQTEVDTLLGYWSWIGSVRAEENRVNDLIMASNEPETVIPSWPVY